MFSSKDKAPIFSFIKGNRAFYDALSEREQQLIQMIFFHSYQALDMKLDLPNINVFVSQRDFSAQDQALLFEIFNLRNSKLNFQIYLDEFFIKNDANLFKELKIYDLPTDAVTEGEVMRSIHQWRQSCQLYWVQKMAMHLEKKTPRDVHPEFLILLVQNLVSMMTSKESELVKQVLSYLMPMAIYHKILCNICSLMGRNAFREIIEMFETEQGFLLQAMSYGKREDIQLLVDLLDHQLPKLYDNNQQTFLHVCRDEAEQIFLSYKLNANINHRNIYGNTPLHIAAIFGRFKLAQYLLWLGADPTIKNLAGKTFWDIPAYVRCPALDLFRDFGKDGEVILFPLIPRTQKGLTCGLYIAEFVTRYFSLWQPSLFKNQPNVARRSDLKEVYYAEISSFTEEALPSNALLSSLRNIAKATGVSEVGEIFTREGLAMLIALSGCYSQSIPIDDYNSFTQVILMALQNKKPVVVPFCDMQPATEKVQVDPDRAHWAAIIGIRYRDSDYQFLLAHRNGYNIMLGKVLFHLFFDIPETTPAFHFYKINEQWKKFQTKQNFDETVPYKSTSSINLNFFRRQLMVINPPASPNENEDERLKKKLRI